MNTVGDTTRPYGSRPVWGVRLLPATGMAMLAAVIKNYGGSCEPSRPARPPGCSSSPNKGIGGRRRPGPLNPTRPWRFCHGFDRERSNGRRERRVVTGFRRTGVPLMAVVRDRGLARRRKSPADPGQRNRRAVRADRVLPGPRSAQCVVRVTPERIASGGAQRPPFGAGLRRTVAPFPGSTQRTVSHSTSQVTGGSTGLPLHQHRPLDGACGWCVGRDVTELRRPVLRRPVQERQYSLMQFSG